MKIDYQETVSYAAPFIIIYLVVGGIAVFCCDAGFWGLLKALGFTTLVIALMGGAAGPP